MGRDSIQGDFRRCAFTQALPAVGSPASLDLTAEGSRAAAPVWKGLKRVHNADKWQKRWHKSSWKKSKGTDGTFTLTAGKWYGDSAADKGIQTGPDARFFAYYAKLDKPFDNSGKDLIVQVCSCAAALCSTCRLFVWLRSTAWQLAFSSSLCYDTELACSSQSRMSKSWIAVEATSS
jgi:hypothetical protein